ncbi:MAG: hypothetical protein QM658_06835, partial [Gordonia sp. (in: high G+C Gram-positive bacteria)]
MSAQPPVPPNRRPAPGDGMRRMADPPRHNGPRNPAPQGPPRQGRPPQQPPKTMIAGPGAAPYQPPQAWSAEPDPRAARRPAPPAGAPAAPAAYAPRQEPEPIRGRQSEDPRRRARSGDTPPP